MTFLKKQNSAILFLVAFSTTFNIVSVIHLTKVVEAFEPVTIKYVQQVEPTETPETVPETTVEPVPEEVIPLISDCPLDDVTQHMIYQKCVEYGIEYPFVMAVIFKESSFRPNADSGSSVGLMQINRVNHGWLSKKLRITDFFDPEQNVTAGLFMLRQLFDKYDDPAKVLMAYNMGESGARKLWNKGIYSTDYAEGVLQLADKYSEELKERMG